MEIFKGALRFLPLGGSLEEMHVQIPQLLHLKGERPLKILIFSLTSVVLHSFQSYRFWGQEKSGFWISIEIETLQGVEITFLESRLEANAGQLNKSLIKVGIRYKLRFSLPYGFQGGWFRNPPQLRERAGFWSQSRDPVERENNVQKLYNRLFAYSC